MVEIGTLLVILRTREEVARSQSGEVDECDKSRGKSLEMEEGSAALMQKIR